MQSDPKLYLYLVQALTYGSFHPIKIGVSKNVKRRMQTLSTMGISCPSLLGTFEFSSREKTLFVEKSACQKFPRDCHLGWRNREILHVLPDEIIKFVISHDPIKFELKPV